jgi:hypothetical protein
MEANNCLCPSRLPLGSCFFSYDGICGSRFWTSAWRRNSTRRHRVWPSATTSRKWYDPPPLSNLLSIQPSSSTAAYPPYSIHPRRAVPIKQHLAEAIPEEEETSYTVFRNGRSTLRCSCEVAVGLARHYGASTNTSGPPSQLKARRVSWWVCHSAKLHDPWHLRFNHSSPLALLAVNVASNATTL